MWQTLLLVVEMSGCHVEIPHHAEREPVYTDPIKFAVHTREFSRN
jgi:hypothetical protein